MFLTHEKLHVCACAPNVFTYAIVVGGYWSRVVADKNSNRTNGHKRGERLGYGIGYGIDEAVALPSPSPTIRIYTKYVASASAAMYPMCFCDNAFASSVANPS